MKFKLGIAATMLATFSMLTATTPVSADTPERVYEGEGWKSLYASYPDLYKIKSIDISEPYVFNWYDEASRDMLRPYVEDAAAQLEYITGGDFIVSTEIDTRTSYTCENQPDHVITMFAYHRPVGANRPGISKAYPCYQISDESAWGGMVTMTSEYWLVPNWFSTDPEVNEYRRRNIVSHEIIHILGLDHPNIPDANGTLIPSNCVNDGVGLQPVACSPGLGYQNSEDGGEFTDWDIEGLQQLVANHDIPE